MAKLIRAPNETTGELEIFVEFEDGRRVPFPREKITKEEIETLRLIRLIVDPVDTKVVEINDRIKTWVVNKLNSIEDKLDQIIAYQRGV